MCPTKVSGPARGADAKRGSLVKVATTTASTGALAASASLVALLTARWLGPHDRGAIVIVTTLATLLLLLSSLGCGTGLRVLTQGAEPLPIAAALQIINRLTLLATCLTAVVGAPLLILFGAPATWGLAVALTCLTAIQLLNYLQRELVHGLGRHSAALLGETVANCAVLATVMLLHFTGSLGLAPVLAAMIIANSGQSLVLGRILAKAKLIKRPDERLMPARKVVRQCLPALGTALGQSAIQRGDRLVVGAVVGSTAVGIYGVAATVADAVWLLPLALSQVALRSVSTTGQRSGARAIAIYGLLGVTVIGLAVAALAGPILSTLVGKSYASGTTSLRVLAVAAIPMGAYVLGSAVLNGLRRFRDVQTANLAGAVTLIVTCGLMIPRYGIDGAAWSSLLSYIVMATVVAGKLIHGEPVDDGR